MEGASELLKQQKMTTFSTCLNSQQKETVSSMNPAIFLTIRKIEGFSGKQLIFENPPTLICENCGCEITFTKIDICGLGTRFLLNSCPCEEKRREEADKRQSDEKFALARKAKIEKLFKLSQIGERFKNTSFQNWEIRIGTEFMYKAFKDFAINFETYKMTGKSLLVYGVPGNGKTHLSVALANYLLKKGHSVIFQVVPDMLVEPLITKVTRFLFHRSLHNYIVSDIISTGLYLCSSYTIILD